MCAAVQKYKPHLSSEASICATRNHSTQLALIFRVRGQMPQEETCTEPTVPEDGGKGGAAALKANYKSQYLIGGGI